MDEAETRAELINPAMKEVGQSVVGDGRLLSGYYLSQFPKSRLPGII